MGYVGWVGYAECVGYEGFRASDLLPENAVSNKAPPPTERFAVEITCKISRCFPSWSGRGASGIVFQSLNRPGFCLQIRPARPVSTR